MLADYARTGSEAAFAVLVCAVCKLSSIRPPGVSPAIRITPRKSPSRLQSFLARKTAGVGAARCCPAGCINGAADAAKLCEGDIPPPAPPNRSFICNPS